MKATLGYGASTCSYADWLHADLIVLFGSNVANNQPVTTKYLHHGEGERRADRGGESVPRAGPRSATGCRRSPRARCSARRSPTTGSTCTPAAISRFSSACFARSSRCGGVDEAFVRERTVGFEAARDAALRRGLGRARARERRDARRDARVRAAAGRPAERHLRLVDGADAARARRRHDRGADQRRHSRAACPAGRTAAWCRFAATLACRAAPKSAASRSSTRRPPRAGRDVLGVSGRSRAAAGRRRRWSSTRPAATSISSGSSAATFSRRCRRRAVAAGAAAAAPAHSPGHRAVVVDARRQRRRRADPAGGDAIRIGRRRHRDVDRAADHLLAGDSRAGGSASRGPSGGCSAKRWRARCPIAPTTSASRAPRRSAPRSRARCRCTPASRRSRRKGDQIQWGGRTLVRGRPVRDAGRQGALRGRSR